MLIYRLAKAKYADDLNGNGSRINGGRWNHKGTAVVYASSARSLAILEYIVHTPMQLLPEYLNIITIDVPDSLKPKNIIPDDLPKNWQNYPASNKLADLGSQWAASKASVLLRVPSAVVPQECNYILNPLHQDMDKIKIIETEKFQIDDRLTGRF